MNAKEWTDQFTQHYLSYRKATLTPQQCLDVANAIDALQAKYDSAIEMLESVQWHCVGRVDGRCGTCYRCGECGGYRDDGHEPNCELADILNEAKENQ